MHPRRAANEKPLHWVGSSKRDLLDFPRQVIRAVGYDLSAVQHGGRPTGAKPWKGLGPGVWELVESAAGGTYREGYTVQFRSAIYVLHAFHKKSPTGIRTPATDVELIRQRLRAAREDYEER